MLRGLLFLTAFAGLTRSTAAGAVELTQENFADNTKGKNSFVKFVSTVPEVTVILLLNL
jgi:hypothetical protein